MSDNLDPDTRELIAEGERLRAGKRGRVPKTRQLVSQSERLIGRRRGGGGLRPIVWVALVGIIAAAVLGYLLWFRF